MSTLAPSAAQPPPTQAPTGAGASVGDACPLCGAPLAPAQEWCLRCGAAARTRLAAAPNWKVPAVVLATIALLALGAIAAAAVKLAGDTGPEPAPLTRTVASPVASAPVTPVAPATTTPASTTPAATTPLPATATPPTATTTPGAPATASPKAATPATTTPARPRTTTSPRKSGGSKGGKGTPGFKGIGPIGIGTPGVNSEPGVNNNGTSGAGRVR